MNDTIVEILSEGLNKDQLDYICRSLKDIFRDDAVCNMRHPGERKEFPIESDYKAIDFDNIKKIFVNTRRNEDATGVGINYRSNDALMLSPKKEWWFVECKDGNIGETVIKEIREKIEDSNFILFNIDYLSKGRLKVDGESSCLEREKTPDFKLYEKLKKLNMPVDSGRIWEYMNYCLIYNKRIYEMTDTDKIGWRNLLKNGEFSYLEDFYSNHAYLYNDCDVKTFLNNCLDDSSYPLFKNVMDVYDRYGEILREKRPLILFFDKETERDRFIFEYKRLDKIYRSLKSKITSGKEMIIFLYLYRNSSDKNLLKRIEETNERLKVSEEKTNSSGVGRLYKYMAKLSTQKHHSWRLFNLQALEGKFYKKVVTLSEEEFLSYFDI